ncbi:uncharacterized protein LOC126835809 [Adelges cooleyi]|uniref:uncharacterized protein LOC126835809 n=1 Tax=Adelges cooleyi TaxID=133065 RepID=UPI00218015CA|nr:uncharacterized protein LOC126835809 [Adelges cooleyi]
MYIIYFLCTAELTQNIFFAGKIFHNVSIMNMLFLLTMIIALASYSHQFLPDEKDNQQLIDKLNALLINSGWGRLNHLEVKYHDDTQGQSSFSGIDLLIVREEPDQCSVTKKNVGKKYYMTVTLLGCVYANAMHKFVQLIRPIIVKCNIEVRLANQRANNQRRTNMLSCDSASAIMIRDINTTPHKYVYREDADDNITTFHKNLKKSLNRQVRGVLSPIMREYCIIPKESYDIDLNQIPSTDANTIENETTGQPLEASSSIEDVVKLEIEKHVEEVINKYFLDLGFHYVDIPN